MDGIAGSESQESSPNLKLSISRVAILPAKRATVVAPIVAGLLAALRKSQVSVGILVIGGVLSQLTHYRRLSGKLSFSLYPGLAENLDDLALPLVRAASGAEIVLIEGQDGIRDLYPDNFVVSTTHQISQTLSTPAILVIDGEGYKESISSLIKGFISKDEYHGISGVIVVNAGVGIDAQKRSLEQLEAETGVRLVGIIPRTEKNLVDFSDKLEDGAGVSRTRLLNSLELVSSHINLDILKEISSGAPTILVPRQLMATKSRVCKIAVADDVVMNEMFQDNLELLRKEGAELVAFSPLSDEKLPSHVRAIYLPSGRLERYVEGLSTNNGMKDSIRNFAKDGGVIYAEGSSLSYLFSNVLSTKGQSYPMLGLIKGNATYLSQDTDPESNIYVGQELLPNILLCGMERIRGLRFSRWAYRVEDQIQFAFRTLTLDQLSKSESELEENPPISDGFMPRQNVIGTAFSYNWIGCPKVAERFVKFALGSTV